MKKIIKKRWLHLWGEQVLARGYIKTHWYRWFLELHLADLPVNKTVSWQWSLCKGKYFLFLFLKLGTPVSKVQSVNTTHFPAVKYGCLTSAIFPKPGEVGKRAGYYREFKIWFECIPFYILLKMGICALKEKTGDWKIQKDESNTPQRMILLNILNNPL